MTIGLVLLAVVAILIFFGVSEKFFRALGIKNWLAFLLVLALVIGSVVPSVTIAGVFTFNFGGFIIPLVIMTVLMVIMRSGKQVFRALLAILTVAAVAVTTRMLIEPTRGALILAASLIVGFLGGIVAYLTGQTRLSALAGALGGIILGDIITNFLYVYAFGGYMFSLGSYGVFDSIIIAVIFAVILYEAVAAIKKTAERRGTGRAEGTFKKRAVAEAGEDQYFMEDFERQRTDFASVDIDDAVKDSKLTDIDGKRTGNGDRLSSEDIDSFFDDYV